MGLSPFRGPILYDARSPFHGGNSGDTTVSRRLRDFSVDQQLRHDGGNMKAACLLTAISAFFIAAVSRAEDDLKAFPPAEEGKTRYVLRLPQQEDESAFKVELIVGKTVETDAVNQHFFGGKIEEETIEGWGFPRFLVRKVGPMGGTLIAVDPNAPKVERFVTLRGDPFLIRYNSRLPVVLYVPEGFEARYRIWKAEAKTHVMNEG
jgi:ecotin